MWGAPVIARGPGAEDGDALGKQVKLLRGDHRCGGVAKEGFEARCCGEVVSGNLKVRKRARRDSCP